MKISKTIISLFLALLMLISALPLTASAADTAPADTGAETDIADTGEIRVFEAATAKDLDTLLVANNTGYTLQINVTADITAYVGTPGDHSDANYVPIYCTVGQGKKILNLNGHALNYQSDYVCIYNGYEYGDLYLESKSNECLFSIPVGAELEVNGDSLTEHGKYGSIKYDGVVLERCDAIDQRDIFHVDGGKLIINSGNYLAPTNTYLIWYNYRNDDIYPVNGTAVTVNSRGSLIINGGYFEGKGVNAYKIRIDDGSIYHWSPDYDKMNGALEIKSYVPTVEINGGHFMGVFHSCPVRMPRSENVIFRGGRFTVDGNTKENIVTKYEGPDAYGVYTLDELGIVGVVLNHLDEDTVYYTTNPFTVFSDTQSIYALETELIIAPKTKKSGVPGYPDEDNKYLRFWRNGVPYDSTYTTDEEWKVNNDFIIEIGDESFYYPKYIFDEFNTRDIGQLIIGTLTVHKYISEGNRPQIIDEELQIYAYKEDGVWKVNLKDVISEEYFNKFEKDELYVLEFHVDEEYRNANGKQTVTHLGWYYLNIDTRPNVISDLTANLEELPFPGHRPSMTATVPDGANYSVSDVYWFYNGSLLDKNAGLIPGANYHICVELEANDGYRFSKGISGTISGKKAAIQFSDAPERTKLQMSISYTCPDGITNLEAAITVPQAGKYPSYSATVPKDVKYAVEDFTSGTYFKNGVQWYNISDGSYIDPDNIKKFVEGDRYQVIISFVTVNNTYRFSTTNRHATLNGNDTSFLPFSADTQLHNVYIKYIFTVGTLDTMLTEVSATVIEPVENMHPNTKVTVPEGRGYSAVGANPMWKDSTGNTVFTTSVYEAGKKYTCTMELTAADGYRFPTSGLNAYINGEAADVFYTDRKHVKLSKTFTAHDVLKIYSVMADITPPRPDEYPDLSPSTDSGLYEVSISKWIDLSTGKDLDTSKPFEAGKRYRIVLRFDTELGKKFDENLKGYLNGEIMTLESRMNNVAYLYADFYSGDGAPVILDHVACTVEEPKGGKLLPFTAVSEEPDKYTIKINYWQDRTAGGNITSSSDVTAVVGHEYRLYLTYVMNDGYYADTTADHYVNEDLATKGSNAQQYYVSLYCYDEASQYKVQALVHSFLDMEETLEAELLRSNGSIVSTSSVKSDNLIVFNNVVEGDYILRVAKKDHVTRNYSFTVSGDTDLIFQINPLGDIDGDGATSTFDFALANAHAKGVTLLEGYALDCANVDGEGDVTTFDAALINSHAKGVSLLY